MKSINEIIFVTSDNSKFFSELEALNHEKELSAIELYKKLCDINFFYIIYKKMGWDKELDIPNFQYCSFSNWYSTHDEGGDWAGVETYIDRCNSLIFIKKASWLDEKNYETLMVIPLEWNELNEQDLLQRTNDYINFRENKILLDEAQKLKLEEYDNSLEGQVLKKVKFYTKEQKEWIIYNIDKFIEFIK